MQQVGLLTPVPAPPFTASTASLTANPRPQKGDLVWFDPDVGYFLPGVVVDFCRGAQVTTIEADFSGQKQTFTIHKMSNVRKREELGESGVDDMVKLGELSEGSILWNLKIRYEKEIIYTFIGNILVAVNPYQVASVYGLDAVKKYKGQILGTLSPHLFAVANSAYTRMTKENEHQAFIISGESGAGKTETSKLVMQYLAAVNKSVSNIVTEQILEASPLLESFGNAKTVKNNNSSRFGKYLEVFFKDGIICGAKTTEYLLEKSRIVTQALEERNYHVFYELLAGLSEQEKEKYGLQSADKYFYLNQGGSCEIEGKNDEEDFRFLLSAMQVLGFTNEEQDNIFSLLAAVLHLGNVYFHRKQLKHGQEGVEIGSDAEVRWISHLLQLPLEGILKAITFRTTETRNERVYTALNIDQALDSRDALAKSLYSSLFSWLVHRVNNLMSLKGSRKMTLALLDIFGFEEFKENSFEQLCINFANETLHFYFTKYVFKVEQQEYVKEKIDWQNIPCPDNQNVLNLISKKPEGILPLLDDESNFPKATDHSFLEKCHYNHALSEVYSRPRMSSMEFGIKHYAGQVWYTVDGFLDKNRDTLRSDVLDLLSGSRMTMIAKIFSELRNSADSFKTYSRSDGRFVTMKPRAPTVATRFQDSLATLLDTMSRCNPWFVRCIKPNNEKAPLKFDIPVVLQQLRYSGVLETVRIRQLGYTVRLKFQTFVSRYRCLLQGRRVTSTSNRDLCRSILQSTANSESQYQLGQTKVFMRESVEQELESARARILRGAVVTMQKYARGYLTRKRLRNAERSAILIQSVWRGFRCRRNYVKIQKGIARAQATWKMHSQRKQYNMEKQLLARRKEAQRQAAEKAKRDQEREVSRKAADRIPVPSQLAAIFEQLDDWNPSQTDKNIVKAMESPAVSSAQKHLKMPRDVDAHSFAKFTNIYFRTNVWGARSDSIETPFLSKSNEADFHQSLSIFKLILRYQNDNALSGLMAKTIADYIIQKGLSNEYLRDEILCQLCNQTWKNDSPESAERAWILMANVLSSFPPSRNLFKYLLQYVSEHAPDTLRAILQNKLLRSSHVQPANVRTYPPTLLEHTANSNSTSMALEANLPNGDAKVTSIDSWSTGEEFAADLLKSKSIKQTFGWSVDLLDGDDVFELNGTDYVLDLISETEMPPSFPTCCSFFLTSPDRSKHRKAMGIHDAQSISTYDPDLLDDQFYGKDENMESAMSNDSAHKGERGSVSHEELAMRLMSDEYCILSNSVQSLDRNNMSLSKQSKLNQRYLTNDKGRSGHKLADKSRGSKRFITRNDHKSQPSLSKRSVSMQELGLATSALNERYFYLRSEMQKSASVTNQHNGIDSAGMLKPANDRCFLESDYLSAQSSAFLRLQHQNPIRPSSRSSSSTISSEDANVNGDGNTVTDHCSTSINARYVKYPGKQNGRHSHAHSTKAYIDKSDRRTTDGDNYSIGPRSSAMSDTSEAPSLASHVRNVKIPSHMSELDQYLDDLFNPVLDGGLDELSDARSLAASIKGGSGGLCILTQVDVDLNGLEDLVDGTVLSDRLKGGGVRGGAQQVQSSIPFPGAKKTSPADDSNMGNASSAFTNVAGMTVPIVDTSHVIQHQLVHQQMIQRAFLASAVQQNLQMQQKLLEQNEALQKILQGNPPEESSLSSLIQDDSGISSSTFLSNNSAVLTVESAAGVSESAAGTTGIPPPPPPPPPPPSPPPLSPTDPFHNVYGRAKTVRIGKWRWPPPRDDGEAPTANSFLEFKMKKHQEKSDGRSPDEEMDQQVTRPVHSSNQLTQVPNCSTTTSFAVAASMTTTSHQTSAQEPKEEIILLKNKLTKSNASANRISKAGSASSLDLKVDANVGKLRISSEMKAKLEQLTIDQSVRSGKPSGRDKMTRSLEDVADAAGVRKLSEQRKSLLEQQLLGSMRLPGITPPSSKPIEAMEKVMHRSHETIAADDGLVRIEGRFAPHRRSMNRESRERRDELGPRGPGTIASTVKAECGDDNISHTLSDNLFFEDGNSTRNGSIYGGESIDSSPRKSLFCADSKNQQQQVKRMGIPPPPPPNPHQRPDQRPSTACSSVFNGTVTPLVVRKKDVPPLPSNIRSLSHEHLTSHKFGESDFLSSAAPSTTASAVREYQSEAGTTRTKLFQPSDNIYLTYSRVNWELRLRKEVFYPGERIDDPVTLNLIFCQIVRDAFCKHMIRLCREDRDELQAQLRNSGITIDNVYSGSHKLSLQRDIIEFAKDLPTYFCRFYPVTGGRKQPDVNLLGLSHSGLRFVQREKGFLNDVLKVIDALSFDGIADIAAPKRTIIQILLRSGGWITLYTPKAYQIRDLLEKFIMECHKAEVEFVRAIEDHCVQDATLLSFRKGDVIRIVRSRNMHISKGWFYGVLESGEGGIFPQDYVVPLNRQEVRRLVDSMDDGRNRNGHANGHYHENSTGGSFSSVEEEIQESSCWVESKSDHVDDSKSDGTHSSNLQDGKFSLLQFALFNFKEALEKYELVRNRDGSMNVDPMTMMESLKSKKKKKKKNGDGSDWTWKELSDLVKFTPTPITSPLLKLTSNELNKLAVDCFMAIMRYMGDHSLAKNQTEVDCVYTVLVNCHRYPQLRDEVFCQIMKQTTSNKSQNSESCRRGWRLFAIIAAYFDCSENLRPYLFKHLETAAYDKRRAYHGMAVLTLTSLRKTFRFGGRKNVPSIEEIAAISAGRNSKRQMFRLPGGTERIVNTSSTTVVQDVIEEICSMLGVTVPLEMEEFSLYCIVEGDPYTMPLNRDEYILDVTTELLKNGQVFYLIFCRSVWFFPLRLDSQLYIEVVFNQVAPDYLEGLLLVTPNYKLPEECVPDIARVAALLHRAADMEHTPTRDEVKFLLPKPVLPLRDIKPGQWVEMVQTNWQDMSSLTTTEAKAQCLDILQKWPLFGSCFFAIKLIQNESLSTSDHILALNRDGVHFLDVSTHENAGRYPYAEVISTRKVRAEDGTLYLDMKCGNLMVQRITRIQTDQAHEISRLIRQYIDIQSPGNGETPPNGVTLSRHPHQHV